MSVKYNSELIDSLYQALDSENASSITDEMSEIGDPIFIYPIFAAYKKFKQGYQSHYFLKDLISFEQLAAIEILKRIISEETMIRSADMYYLIDFCIKNEYYPENFTQQIKSFFYNELLLDIENGEFKYELNSYLSYIYAVKKFDEIEKTVISIFEEDKAMRDARKIALQYLLKYDAKKYLQHYYDNYELIKGRKAEIIFVNEINRWKNGIIPKIKEKIIKDGSERAREIIEKELKVVREAEQRKEAEKEKSTEIKFSNAEIISEIVDAREKINILTVGDTRFGFPLFESTELLFKQIYVVEEEQKLISNCIDLRAIIQDFNKKIAEHEVSFDDAKKYITGFNKAGSINNLHLFLVSRGIKVDDSVFGIRDINMILAKIAHPIKGRADLIEKLKVKGLYELYKNGDWKGLHKKLLSMYKDFLDILRDAVSGE